MAIAGTGLTQEAAVLRQVAIAQQSGNSSDRPTPEAVVAAMVALEKGCRKGRGAIALADLLGEWRLTFVTGTKKTRQRAGKAIGAGRYLPGIPRITITYERETDEQDGAQGSGLGRAVNRIQLGALGVTVAGPIEAIANTPILAFDFTQWSVALGAWEVYCGELGGGVASDATFAERPLKERPFFNYFWVSETAIAARGKGGGLALWVKTETVLSP